jgi:3-oxoacyl-(acyl-carrier-protein) synthase
MSALAHAVDLMRGDNADAMFVGGVDAICDEESIAVLGRSGLFSAGITPAEASSRPFDAQRTGPVMSEGAAMLLLERRGHAERRGAHIYARVSGLAERHVPSHASQHERESSMARVIQGALASARIRCDDVDYVSAYGSAGIASDRLETAAIKHVFGAHAHKLWISSCKGSVGHMLGATGAFDLAVAALSLSRAVVPPTLNLAEPDAECDLDYVPNHARERRVSTSLVNSFSETGQQAAVVLRAAS